MNGRFSHPRSDRRFPTSTLAVVNAQRFAERHDDDISLGVYEDDETEGRRQVYRVERVGDAVITTKVANAIREEPNMATGTTTRKRKGGTNPDGSKGGTRTETVETPDAEVADLGTAMAGAMAESIAEAAETKETKVSNGTIDRDAVTKSVKGKMTRAKAQDRIAEERYEAAVKYGVRMQLHKDGVRTKPTDFARQGLTKDDVAVLAEALGV